MFTCEMDSITKAGILLGVPEGTAVSASALITALSYEGDIVYMLRSGSKSGDMKLPMPPGDRYSIEPLPTDKISRVSRELGAVVKRETLVRERMSRISDLETSMAISLDGQTRDNLARSSEEINIFSILGAFTSLPETRQEMQKCTGILYSRRSFASATSTSEYRSAVQRESPSRLNMALRVKSAISKSLTDPEKIKSVLAIPVVGFGSQSKFLEQTGRLLESIDIPPDTLMILNVNCPEGQVPDNTYTDILSWSEKMNRREIRTVVVDTATGNGGTRMGDVRSSCFDGYILTRKDLAGLNRVAFISTDDDCTDIPCSWLCDLADSFKRSAEISAVFSPVDFSLTGAGRDFALTEILRREIAVDYLNQIRSFRSKRTGQAWLAEMTGLFFGGVNAGYIESVILSSFAVRADAYCRIGGFPPTDEITKTARLLFLDAFSSDSRFGVAGNAVTTDSKRQYRAYLLDGVPPVAAWKSPSSGFKSDIIDPVRVSAVRSEPATNPAAGLSDMLAVTFEYMGITDPDVAVTYLNRIGLDPDKFTVQPAGRSLFIKFK